MQDRQLLGDVFNLHVVGDDVTLESRLKRLAQLRLGIEEKTIAFGADDNVGVYFALRGQNASLDRARLARLANIIGDLAVEKTDSIAAGDAQLRA